MTTKRTLLAGLTGLFITGIAAFAGQDSWKTAQAQGGKDSCCAPAKTCCEKKLACCKHEATGHEHAAGATAAAGGCCAAMAQHAEHAEHAHGCCAH